MEMDMDCEAVMQTVDLCDAEMGSENLPPHKACTLVDLPDEVIVLVGCAALANSACDACRLCQACKSLHNKLAAVRLLAEARRLHWIVPYDLSCNVSDKGRTLTVTHRVNDSEIWVTGGPLPTAGTSAWKVCIERSKNNDGNGLWIGVCDEAASCSWGLLLSA